MKSHKGAAAHSEWEESFSQKKAAEVKGPGAKREQNACVPATDTETGPCSQETGSCLQTNLSEKEIKCWAQGHGPSVPCPLPESSSFSARKESSAQIKAIRIWQACGPFRMMESIRARALSIVVAFSHLTLSISSWFSTFLSKSSSSKLLRVPGLTELTNSLRLSFRILSTRSTRIPQVMKTVSFPSRQLQGVACFRFDGKTSLPTKPWRPPCLSLPPQHWPWSFTEQSEDRGPLRPLTAENLNWPPRAPTASTPHRKIMKLGAPGGLSH